MGNATLPLRIPLVEDHADTLAVSARLLAKGGHEVVATASISADALAAAADAVAGGREIDFAVVDIVLPDGDGCELFRELRRRLPRLRGLAFTGQGTDADVQRCREAGFHGHVQKPVGAAELAAAVARAMSDGGA